MPTSKGSSIWAAAAISLATGCAPALSTFIPAGTTPAGHGRNTLGYGVNLPVGQVAGLITEGVGIVNRARNHEMVTDAEVNTVIDTVVGLALTPPLPNEELQFRGGIAAGFDFGVRFQGSSYGADLRYQILRRPHAPFDLSIGAGVSTASVGISSPIFSLQDVARIDDLERVSFDFPLLLGWSASWGHLWFGAKTVYSTYSGGISLNIPGQNRRAIEMTGSSWHTGGLGGACLGYRWVWMCFELTVMSLAGQYHAQIAIPDAMNFNYERTAQFGGVVFYPAWGLLLQI